MRDNTERSGVRQTPHPIQRRDARGQSAANALAELVLAADEGMQEKLYELAGAMSAAEFQEAQEALAQWQRLSQALISIIGKT